MPTCLHCGDHIDVDDWDNPVEWETHCCEGVRKFHAERAESDRVANTDTSQSNGGAEEP